MSNSQDQDWVKPTFCNGKHRFESKALANEVAIRMSKKYESRSTAYKCVVCAGWHIGESRSMQTNYRKTRK